MSRLAAIAPKAISPCPFADIEHGWSAEVEAAAIPELGRDDPPAADRPASHRHAHGEASASSFGKRTRL